MGNRLKKSLFFWGYYTLLIIVLLSWKETDAAPPMYQRLLFVLASLVPSCFYKSFFLPIIVCFSTISYYGYSHTYFPAELMFILPIILVVSLFQKQVSKRVKRGNYIMLILAIYTAFVDLLSSGIIQPISLSFLAIYMFGILLDNDEKDFRLLGYTLCITSIVLSYEFFHVGDEMVREYSSLGMSRVFLRDPNYYGAIIAAGAVVAFREQLNSREKNIYEKGLYILTVLITSVTVILNASRGAMLSLTLSSLLLTMLYPTKVKYKVFTVVAVVIGGLFLYNNGYFDFLQYRIESDSGTGSERTIIWAKKLFAFSQEGGFFNLLFGYGYKDAMSLGINAAFHNDFIAMLVEYGVIGLVLLISLLLMPLIKSRKKRVIEPAILLIFLLLAITTIEPITSGRYAHLFFYVYVEKLVLLNNERLNIHH